jgi:hypothetical protein
MYQIVALIISPVHHAALGGNIGEIARSFFLATVFSSPRPTNRRPAILFSPMRCSLIRTDNETMNGGTPNLAISRSHERFIVRSLRIDPRNRSPQALRSLLSRRFFYFCKRGTK